MIDFKKLKQHCSILEVARGYLALKLKQENGSLRSKCPACDDASERSLIISPDKGVFYCFHARKGGDLITLVAHCHDISVKEAAEGLAKVYLDADVIAQRPKEESCGLAPLAYLDSDHPLVEELGFKDIAKQAGIGYAGKGLMRTCVAIPVRLADGTLVGYLGIKGQVTIPKKWRVA